MSMPDRVYRAYHTPIPLKLSGYLHQDLGSENGICIYRWKVEVDTDFIPCHVLLHLHSIIPLTPYSILPHCWVSLEAAIILSTSDLFCACVVLHSTLSDSSALEHQKVVRSFAGAVMLMITPAISMSYFQ